MAAIPKEKINRINELLSKFGFEKTIKSSVAAMFNRPFEGQNHFIQLMRLNSSDLEKYDLTFGVQFVEIYGTQVGYFNVSLSPYDFKDILQKEFGDVKWNYISDDKILYGVIERCTGILLNEFGTVEKIFGVYDSGKYPDYFYNREMGQLNFGLLNALHGRYERTVELLSKFISAFDPKTELANHDILRLQTARLLIDSINQKKYEGIRKQIDDYVEELNKL
jgi:hypothetical protein